MFLETDVIGGHPLDDFLWSDDLGFAQLLGVYLPDLGDVTFELHPLCQQEHLVLYEV
jgi:hypothetical protein